MKKFPPLSDKAPVLLHGADYNPDQWLDCPEVLDKDIEMMKQTRCNVMSVGIFSWASLEPEEGRRITSYNVCYTKLLRGVARNTEMPFSCSRSSTLSSQPNS